MSRTSEEISPEATCTRFEEALPEFLEIEGEGGSLSAEERDAMSRHAAVCARCGELLRGYRRTVDLLRELPGKAAPPGFLDWVSQELRKEGAGLSRSPWPARRRLPLAAAAALALGATGALLWALLGGSGSTPTELASSWRPLEDEPMNGLGSLEAEAEPTSRLLQEGRGKLEAAPGGVPLPAGEAVAEEAEQSLVPERSRDRAMRSVKSGTSAPSTPDPEVASEPGGAKGIELARAAPLDGAELARKRVVSSDAAIKAAESEAQESEPVEGRTLAAREVATLEKAAGVEKPARREDGAPESAAVASRDTEPGVRAPAAPPSPAVLPASEGLVIVLASSVTPEALQGLEKELGERFGVRPPAKRARRQALRALGSGARAGKSPEMADASRGGRTLRSDQGEEPAGRGTSQDLGSRVPRPVRDSEARVAEGVKKRAEQPAAKAEADAKEEPEAKAGASVREIVLRVSSDDVEALQRYLSAWARARGGALRLQPPTLEKPLQRSLSPVEGAPAAREKTARTLAAKSDEREEAREALAEIMVRIILKGPEKDEP